MSKRWDEAFNAACDASLECYEDDREFTNGVVRAALEAFALSAHGPSGPAALKDWVEGRAVLVPAPKKIAGIKIIEDDTVPPGVFILRDTATGKELGRIVGAASPTVPDEDAE